MRLQPFLLAGALIVAPVATTVQAADCGADLTKVTEQLHAASLKAGNVAAPQGARSGWVITWNRMATASENAYAATLPPADVAPTGVTAATADHPGWATGAANTLARARDSVQAATAAHARGDEALCTREIADARDLLAKLG